MCPFPEVIFIVMGVKQPQLLVAVDRVKSIVDVQDDALRHVDRPGRRPDAR